MANLWNEIAELADFNKDGEVDGKEFADAVQKNCMNKPFAELPAAFKAFIHEAFKSIDVDGDGSVGLTEFRVDCVNRMAYKNCTPNSSATPTRNAQQSTCSAPLRSSTKRAVSYLLS